MTRIKWLPSKKFTISKCEALIEFQNDVSEIELLIFKMIIV